MDLLRRLQEESLRTAEGEYGERAEAQAGESEKFFW
jgi:hypothetical protein